MNNFITKMDLEFKIVTVVADTHTNIGKYTVYLFNKEEKILLPIQISPVAANSLLIAQDGSKEIRPHIHNTAVRLIKSLKGKIREIIISGYKNEIFYAYIKVEGNGNLLEIDCKPSDAIAIALRCNVPIKVCSNVIKSSGIRVTKEILDRSLTNTSYFNTDS